MFVPQISCSGGSFEPGMRKRGQIIAARRFAMADRNVLPVV
jgi:hypothetical protein